LLPRKKAFPGKQRFPLKFISSELNFALGKEIRMRYLEESFNFST